MNFDENDQNSIADFVWRELARHKQFALATINEYGKPWNVCLNLSYDEQLDIFWKSHKNTEHSKNIALNKDVAICVFSEHVAVGDYGLYLSCEAHEATDAEEISYIIKYRYAGKELPAIEDFIEGSSTRLYRAKVKQAWVNDDRHTKTEIDLRVLRERRNES